MTAIIPTPGIHREVPMARHGLCQCGCGNSTPMHTRANAARGYVVGEYGMFLRGHQPKAHGSRHHKWNGGQRVGRNGYIEVRSPSHPRSHNGYVYAHVLVVEAALGRPLPGKHPIHHVDEARQNNTNGNLVVCENDAYHKLLHKRQRALDACGDANAIACKYCGDYSRQEDMHVFPTKTGNLVGYHPACSASRDRTKAGVA